MPDDALAGHLSGCSGCRDWFGQAARVTRLVRLAPATPMPGPRAGGARRAAGGARRPPPGVRRRPGRAGRGRVPAGAAGLVRRADRAGRHGHRARRARGRRLEPGPRGRVPHGRDPAAGGGRAGRAGRGVRRGARGGGRLRRRGRRPRARPAGSATCWSAPAWSCWSRSAGRRRRSPARRTGPARAACPARPRSRPGCADQVGPVTLGTGAAAPSVRAGSTVSAGQDQQRDCPFPPAHPSKARKRVFAVLALLGAWAVLAIAGPPRRWRTPPWPAATRPTSSRLEAAPSKVTVTFSEDVSVGAGFLKVVDSKATWSATGDREVNGRERHRAAAVRARRRQLHRQLPDHLGRLAPDRRGVRVRGRRRPAGRGDRLGRRRRHQRGDHQDLRRRPVRRLRSASCCSAGWPSWCSAGRPAAPTRGPAG